MTDTLPLETLNQKLERLIEEYRTALAQLEKTGTPYIVGPGKLVKAEEALAQFVLFHPELLHAQPSIPELVNAIEQVAPAYYSPDGLEGALIPQLLALPDEIRRLQETYDSADLEYQEWISRGSIDALQNEEIGRFTDKDGELRLPGNDREREIAISYHLTHNEKMVNVTLKRADAHRALTQAKNRLECARLVIQLVCKENRK